MQKIISYLSALTLISAVSLGAEPATGAKPNKEPKIRFADPQGILMQIDEGREIAEKLQAEFKTKYESLQAQEAEYNKKRSSASQADMKDLAKAKKDIEIENESFKYEFEQRQQAISMQMIDKVVKGTENYIKSTGSCDVILPKGLYVAPEFDITADIVDFLNKEYKKIKATSKFKKSDKADEKPATKKAQEA